MGAVKARLMELVYLVIKELDMDPDRYDEIQEWVMDNFMINISEEELIKQAKAKYETQRS